MPDGQQPAGWYSDPAGDATKLRYWDGNNWTEQLMDAATSQAATPSANPYETTITTPTYPTDQNQPYGQQQPYQTQYVQPVPVGKDQSGLATAAMVLGIIGLVGAWIMPLLGYVLGILAVTLGTKGRNSSKAKFGTAGVILGIITLVFACLDHIISIVWLQNFF
jgi:hypothetical protein